MATEHTGPYSIVHSVMASSDHAKMKGKAAGRGMGHAKVKPLISNLFVFWKV